MIQKEKVFFFFIINLIFYNFTSIDQEFYKINLPSKFYGQRSCDLKFLELEISIE